MSVWEDWEVGMANLLMLQDKITPPQQYSLLVTDQDTTEPETSLYNETFIRKDSGQILLSAERGKQDMKFCGWVKGEVTKN
ncbi:hypothetical protein DPMN_126477 [Dreissena polymorpha]|uniref:Uncharacterized protein n=1 Tax=Dreissena polymorpha TaxID=45954 RepID=A0A9D4GZK8_DREPO|nr:hypothetical protein DPMN_126477 [Dreissena polymorpha]